MPADIRADARDWADLQRAVALLEAPTLTAKMANLVGSPLEFAVRKLPASVSARIHSVTEAALYKAEHPRPTLRVHMIGTRGQPR